MSEINYVCSLGPRCHTSKMLKRNKLKLASYPGSILKINPSVIGDILEYSSYTLLIKVLPVLVVFIAAGAKGKLTEYKARLRI